MTEVRSLEDDPSMKEELDEQDNHANGVHEDGIYVEAEGLEGDSVKTKRERRKSLKQKLTMKKAKKGRKRKGSIIISLPDYDTFRNMADTIRDPRERATQLGTPPQEPPRSAPPPEGRVKRMLSILRKGEKRTQCEDNSGHKQWELIIDRVEELKVRANDSKSSSEITPVARGALTPKAALPAPLTGVNLPPLPRPPESAPVASSPCDNPGPPCGSPPGSARSLDQPPQSQQQKATMSNGTSHATSADDKENGADRRASEKADEVLLAIAIYDFEAEHQFELTFKEGDVIEVLDRPPGEWWTGRLNGVCGYFPHTFVALYKPSSVAPGDSDDEESDEEVGDIEVEEPKQSEASTESPSIIMLGPAPPPPAEPPEGRAWEEPKDQPCSPRRPFARNESCTGLVAAPQSSTRPISRKSSTPREPQPSLAIAQLIESAVAPTNPAPEQRRILSASAPAAPMLALDDGFSPLSSPAESPSSSLRDLPTLSSLSAPSSTSSSVSSIPSFTPSACPSPTPTASSCASPPAVPCPPSSPSISLSSSASNTPSQPSSSASSPASTPSSSTGPSPLTSPRILVSAPSHSATPVMSKVAALTQSFTAASALASASTPSAASSSSSSSPPHGATNSGTSTLVQERQRMFVAAASTSTSASSPHTPTMSSLVQERQKMFAAAAASSPSPIRGGANPAPKTGISLSNPSSPFSSPLPAVKPLGSTFNPNASPSASRTKANSSAFSAVKTIGHAVGNSVSPRQQAASASPSPLSSTFFTPPTQQSSSPASQGPSPTTTSTAPRKFKEGTPIVLSRRKDPASLRGLPAAAMSQLSQSTPVIPAVAGSPPTAPANQLHSPLSASLPVLPSTSNQPQVRKMSSETSTPSEWNGDQLRPRRNTAETPLTLTSLFPSATNTNGSASDASPPPAQPATSTPAAPKLVMPNSPPVARAASTGVVRKKSLRVRTPQPLQRPNTEEPVSAGAGTGTSTPATKPPAELTPPAQ